jgi:hypothetical protein
VDDYTDDAFEGRVKDDCLTIVYRLLFIFYAESRTELEILPLSDEVYRDGYSLEMLRDLEQTRLNSQESRDGYFFHETISHLFSLLSSGYHESAGVLNSKSFAIRHIDSPMFDNSKLHHLADVKIRNAKWQEIIRALSLSKKNSRTGRGRISYANLGVNQLGSVYESLLAYRGFYAEEDYIEVHKADTPEDGTFLVPYSRMDDFEANEILTDENGHPVILPKGTFVYRLNGRDRQKSASYYTPEILTRSTVKYTLKGFIDEVAAGTRKASDLLDLKILEPAMGAAAFQNEVVNQLAEAYLTYQQQQRRDAGLKEWRISPDRYRDELQKVKAYIATHNVYGVDLNPTAIELGKLALWLNVIHKDMETPFFANRLSVGNAVIGAWLKTYNKEEVLGIPARGQKLAPNPWWEKSPKKIKFYQNRVNRSVNEVYHFLLPDKSMLGVRTIKEQKQANTEADKAMKNCADGWIAPISQTDFRTLQRISGKIDVLLKEYFTDQLSIDKYTRNKGDVWGLRDNSESGSLFANTERVENYANKQRLFDTRYRHDNAYHKLKLVMDYWCALWFWEYKDASSLPTREQYWADIEAMLDVDNDKLDTKTRQAMERHGMNDLFDNVDLEDEGRTLTEEESSILVRSKQELLLGTKGQGQTLNLFEEPERFKIVQRLSDRYHFFHPMLEFIEVFWLRDGFDVICGNPPWINYEFDLKGVLSEKYPEVVIRKFPVPTLREKLQNYIECDKQLQDIYENELTETTNAALFMNSQCLYPLLQGVRTNLYKCVLTNSMEIINQDGFIGLLTPETIYEEPGGYELRRELYKRLRYHFQYQNELRLFAEVDHHTVYGDQLLGPRRSSSPRFASLSNLFHPSTIDACFVHNGQGLCLGKKDSNGNWNTKAHINRIVNYGEAELRVLSRLFDKDENWEGVRLTSIHAMNILNVLSKLSLFYRHISDVSTIITEGLNETTAVDRGIIKRFSFVPDIEKYQMIYSGPHIFVGNPIYKTPRIKCMLNSDYDNVNLMAIDGSYIQRINFAPVNINEAYKSYIKGFIVGQDDKGNDVYDNWIDYYKMGFRRQIGSDSERSLSGAILCSKSSHIGGITSVTFKNYEDLIEFAGLTSSLVLDFYVKLLRISDVRINSINTFPIGINDKFKTALFSRILLLNCLTQQYADLWEECWRNEYAKEQWSIDDNRLKPFNSLERKWSWNTPLRNYFERRQALVEIDVIAAMALGISLEDLEIIYNIQFSVLQQNENDTWYDTKGNIVFTCSRGLTGVGVDRSVWNTIREMKPGETYVHTIEKSELYKGQQVTYYAPFTRCDRIEDYRRAWAHFEPIFNK